MVPLKQLLCVWSVALLSAVEQSVVAPSMWIYLRDLGGTQVTYGLALAAFLVGRMVALPIVGSWADRRPFGEVMRSLVSIGLVGSVLYSISAWTNSPWLAVLGRGLLGIASAVSAATSSFVATNTLKEERTKYIGITQVLSQGMKVCGPGLNIMFVVLPSWNPTREPVALFGPLTNPGWFLAAYHVAALLALVFVYREPARQLALQPGASKSRPSMQTVASHLRGSCAWVNWVVTFQNCFGNQAISWTLPILTDRTLGWGELQNSYLFGAIAIAGISAAALSGCIASKHMEDRKIIVINQLIVGCGLLPLSAFGGCTVGELSESGLATLVISCAVVWTVGFQGQVPGQAGLYTKLIGAHDQGYYQALFQMVMTASRILNSLLLGAINELCPIWLIACLLWCLQWPFLIATWHWLHPSVYEEYHKACDRRRLEVPLASVDNNAPAATPVL